MCKTKKKMKTKMKTRQTQTETDRRLKVKTKTAEAHVVDDLPIPMLVGGDGLQESGVAIDYLRGPFFPFPDKGWVEYVADCQTSGQVDDSVAAHVRCNEEEQLFD